MEVTNMNKTKIYNLIQLGSWVLAFIGLLIIILLPKTTENLLTNLYYAFIILFLIVPFALCSLNLLNYALNRVTKIEAYMVMPLFGLSLFTLLSLINFISSITTQGKIYLALIIFIYLIISFVSAYVIMKMKKYNLRHHILFIAGNFVCYLIYFAISVQISYYYSLNW